MGNFLNLLLFEFRYKNCSSILSLSTVAGLHEHLFALSSGLHWALNSIPMKHPALTENFIFDWTLQITESSKDSSVQLAGSVTVLILLRSWASYSPRRISNRWPPVLLTNMQYPLALTPTTVPLYSMGSRRRKSPDSYLDSCSTRSISNRLTLWSLSPHVCTVWVEMTIFDTVIVGLDS